MTTSSRMDKQTVVYLHNEIPYNNEKELNLHTWWSYKHCWAKEDTPHKYRIIPFKIKFQKQKLKEV